ncbi:hypothetical protein CLOM_g16075 [Closterium sp. NIES-68]|nr:hypothetical protein CLOM_g16075 [Closterium sp. NIES-68]
MTRRGGSSSSLRTCDDRNTARSDGGLRLEEPESRCDSDSHSDFDLESQRNPARSNLAPSRRQRRDFPPPPAPPEQPVARVARRRTNHEATDGPGPGEGDDDNVREEADGPAEDAAENAAEDAAEDAGEDRREDEEERGEMEEREAECPGGAQAEGGEGEEEVQRVQSTLCPSSLHLNQALVAASAGGPSTRNQTSTTGRGGGSLASVTVAVGTAVVVVGGGTPSVGTPARWWDARRRPGAFSA